MARVAYMSDRVLRWFGLNGNSVMALIVSGGISGGCAVPGVMAARTLRDPKERIATLLVVPFMNCGAKLPVYAVLIGAFFFQDKGGMLFLLTLLSWSFALLAAKILRSTVLKGPKTPFVMELPPYRLPTLKGLSIHTWERTWQYIKKAGTVILGFSVILWVLMTFPGLCEEQVKSFEDQGQELTRSFLAAPQVRGLVNDNKELADLNGIYDDLVRKGGKNDGTAVRGLGQRPLLAVAKAAFLLKKGKTPPSEIDGRQLKTAARYLELRGQMIHIDAQEQQAALKRTMAGWIGSRLEFVTRPLGFDYRVNIALVGGFVAKEIVVSTLGTAYSLGEVAADDSGSLSERLKSDPHWDPLLAFTLLIFTMLYVPCFVTVISIARESSWGWAGFSIAFNLVVAYLVALVVATVGRAAGLGL